MNEQLLEWQNEVMIAFGLLCFLTAVCSNIRWSFSLRAKEKRLDITPAERELLGCLRNDWWPERSLDSRDFGERLLLARLILTYPKDIHTRQRCAIYGCGYDAVGCDECMDESDVAGLLARARAIVAGDDETAGSAA